MFYPPEVFWHYWGHLNFVSEAIPSCGLGELLGKIWWNYLAVKTGPNHSLTPFSLSPFSKKKAYLISTPAHNWITTENLGTTQLKRKNSWRRILGSSTISPFIVVWLGSFCFLFSLLVLLCFLPPPEPHPSPTRAPLTPPPLHHRLDEHEAPHKQLSTLKWLNSFLSLFP